MKKRGLENGLSGIWNWLAGPRGAGLVTQTYESLKSDTGASTRPKGAYEVPGGSGLPTGHSPRGGQKDFKAELKRRVYTEMYN